MIQTPRTTVKGNPLPTLESSEAAFDPVRGWAYEYLWKGADITSSIDLANNLAAHGISNRITQARDMAVIHATDSTSEFVIDSWEIVANEEARDLFSDPDFVNAVSDAVNSDAYSLAYTIITGEEWTGAGVYDIIADLRNYLSSSTKISSVIKNPEFDALETAFPNVWGWVAEYYFRQLNGADSFRAQQYVLKHKTNVSNRWTVNVADFGINEIYSTAQLLNEVSSTDLWIFPLPPRLQYKLASIPSQTPPPPPIDGYGSDIYAWGWLKSGSTETTDAMNRVSIETNYVLYMWDLFVYLQYQG